MCTPLVRKTYFVLRLSVVVYLVSSFAKEEEEKKGGFSPFPPPVLHPLPLYPNAMIYLQENIIRKHK
jgi:hypothetical protein